MYDFKNRRVLLTGAAGGLGAPLAGMLESAGAQLVALVLEKTDGGIPEAPNARILAADLSDTTALEQIVQAEIDANGAIDTVINNAAIYPKSEITQLTPEEMMEVFQVNVNAACVLTRICAKDMKLNGFGRIINVSSITYDIGFKELTAYVASKAALIGVARTWARELGPSGVTVNAVSPGAFQTDAEKIHPDPEDYNNFVLEQQALKRRGTPEDFGNVVMFLASEQSGFVTGQNIRVDGGWIMR